MSDSDKKTFLFVGLAVVVIIVLMKFVKPGAGGTVQYVGTPPSGGSGSAPSPTGYNPYLPQGSAPAPSPGGSTQSDTSQWLHFGSSLAQSLGTLGGQLIQTYGGSNDTGADAYDDGW